MLSRYNDLIQGMTSWLEGVSRKLLQSSLQPEKKLCSAMTILFCLHLLQHQLDFHVISEEIQLCLLRIAALSPSGEDEFQYLLIMMPQDESRSVVSNVLKPGVSFAYNVYICICVCILYRKSLVEGLTHLFNSIASKSKDHHTVHLLRALPLIHFLRKDSVPNEPRALTLKWTAWEDPHLHFENVYRTMESKAGYVDHSSCV